MMCEHIGTSHGQDRGGIFEAFGALSVENAFGGVEGCGAYRWTGNVLQITAIKF